MSALILLLLLISAALLIAGIRNLTRNEARQLLASVVPVTTPREETQSSSFDRHILPTAISMARRFAFLRRFVNEADIERKLAYAGRPLQLDTTQFFGLKVLAAAALAFVGLVLTLWGFPGGIFLTLILPLPGFLYPDWWLSGKAKRRQEEITLALPTTLDLLAVCVQAGMGFDAAIESIAARTSGPLSEELQHFLQELRMGEARRNAFAHLVERNNAAELKTFVGAVIQAEDLGVPLATTLEIQAQEMRFRRGERARDLAAKASPKISLITVFLVAPAALCLLLAAIIIGTLGRGGLGGMGAGP